MLTHLKDSSYFESLPTKTLLKFVIGFKMIKNKDNENSIQLLLETSIELCNRLTTKEEELRLIKLK